MQTTLHEGSVRLERIQASSQKLSVLQSILFSIVIFLVLLSLSISYIFSSGISKRTQLFLKLVQSNETAFAYTLTSHAFQQRISPAQFANYLSPYTAGLPDREVLDFTTTKSGPMDDCVRVTLSDGIHKSIEMALVKEEGAWWVNDIGKNGFSLCE